MIAETLRFMFPGIVLGTLGDGADCAIVDEGKGPRIVEWRRAEKQPTIAEIEAAWPAVQVAMAAEAAARKKDDDQRRAGVVEAKRAYTRLQTIIDGADTATVAQMRTAIKQIAIDVQHLIRAAVR